MKKMRCIVICGQIVLLQDTQGYAQAHALRRGQGRANRSAIGGDLTTYGCSYLSSGKPTQTSTGYILHAGLNLYTNVYQFYTAEGRTERTGCAAEFFDLCPESLTGDLEHTRRDILRLPPTFFFPPSNDRLKIDVGAFDSAIT